MKYEQHCCRPKHRQAAKGSGDGWYKAKKTTVKGHQALRGNCRICGATHSVNAHRDHGHNSFKLTHHLKKKKGKKGVKSKGKGRKIGLREKARDVGRYVRR